MDEEPIKAIEKRLSDLEVENGFRIQETKKILRELEHLSEMAKQRRVSQSSSPISGIPFIRQTNSAVGDIYYADKDSIIGKSIEHYGEWCWNEVLLMERFISLGDVVVDVGANIGHHSLALASIVGQSGSVLSIEANSLNAFILQMNVISSHYHNIDVLVAGASDHCGVGSISSINAAEQGNFGEPHINDAGQGQPCPLIELDKVAFNRPPSFIKIDVEGHERHVLKGAKSIIRNARPAMLIEADDQYTISICEEINSSGYNIYLFESHTYRDNNHNKNPNDIWNSKGYSRNILCVPQERAMVVKGLRRFRTGSGFDGEPSRVHYENIEIAG